MLFAWAPGLQADDLTQAILLKDPMNGHSASWTWVWEDFFTPWLGSENWPYYRPLSTLLYVGWIKTFGLYSPSLGLLGILLHSINITLFDRFLRTFDPTAFVRGLLLIFVALSPIAFEPVTWWSSSTDLFQFTMVLAGLLVWTRDRAKTPATLRYLGSTLFLFLGALTKESALVFFPLLFLWEFLQNRKGNEGFPLKLLFLQGLSLLAYVLLRLNAVGLSPTSKLESPPWSFASILGELPFKIQSSLSPLFDLSLPSWIHLALVSLFLILLVAAALRGRTLAGELAFFVLVLPSLFHPVATNLSGSRVLYSALFGGAFFYLLLLTPKNRERSLPRFFRGLTIAFLILSIPATLWVDSRLADRRKRALQLAHAVRAELRQTAEKTPQGIPLALLSFPDLVQGVPLHLPNRNFILTHSASLGRPNPLLDLECLFEPVYGSLRSLQDASPLRALGELGARLAFYQEGRDSRQSRHLLLRTTKPLPKQPQRSLWRRDDLGIFHPPLGPRNRPSAQAQGVSPETIEAVTIQGKPGAAPSTLFLRWKPARGSWSKKIQLQRKKERKKGRKEERRVLPGLGPIPPFLLQPHPRGNQRLETRRQWRKGSLHGAT